VRRRLSNPHLTVVDRVCIFVGTGSSLAVLAWWVIERLG